MIEDGVTGLLVPPHDPVALAGAIVRVVRAVLTRGVRALRTSRCSTWIRSSSQRMSASVEANWWFINDSV